MPLNFGVYAGLNYNMHSPDFPYVPADTIMTTRPLLNQAFSDNANGLGVNLGAIVNYPLDKNFVLSGRLGLNTMSATIENTDGNDTYSYKAERDASLYYLEVSPVVQFHNLLPLKRLYFLTGLEFGIPITGEYDNNETLTEGSQEPLVYNETGVDIADKSVRVALNIGAGYVFNLSENTYLSPEISFRMPFSGVSSNDIYDSWEVPQLRLGVSLTFGLGEDKPQDPDHFLDVSFDDVRYYDKAGNTAPLDRIKVEEVQYTELFPMIPYVFCEENMPFPDKNNQALSAEMETGDFSIGSLGADALEINMHTLDIIGERMAVNDNATIKIIGTVDGSNESSESDLSAKRAEFAKNYLIINYGIKPDRISTVAGELPEKPSAQKDPDGIEENRRIEFSSNDPSILEPIIIDRERQALAEPDLIEFVPKVNSSDSLRKWKLEISQSGDVIREFNGTGNVRPVKWVILPDELKASELPVEYTLYVENIADMENTAFGSVPVDFYSFSRKKVEDRADRTISKFSLILFDFDNADISDKDIHILDKNVLPAISYNSIVQIYGYSDRIGNESYNKKLAEQRAKTVKDYLSGKVKAKKYEVQGVGENNMIFDNNLPIGRQLSRTVQIYVITPKE